MEKNHSPVVDRGVGEDKDFRGKADHRGVK